MKLLLIVVTVIVSIGAQTKAEKDTPMKIKVCVETVQVYGRHVRFTPEEHVQILLNERNASQAQQKPYWEWEHASRSINWFDGPKPISLSYVKSHMPRAMLLELRFPVDQNPRTVQADVDRLLETEKKYNESTKFADVGRDYLVGLLKKYGIGPSAILDEDQGGATPQSECGKWEEREWQDVK